MNQTNLTPSLTKTTEINMNHQPAQAIPHDIHEPDHHSRCGCHYLADCPENDTTPINTHQLANIAELLALLDGFLRHTDTIADHLAQYLHATRRNHQPPNGARYDANLLIDQISFTAHSLRAHQREPLQ